MNISILRIFKCYANKLPNSNFQKFLHTTIPQCGIKWRVENNLETNPNKYGPLTNLPDYSFLDGRPTPLGTRQRKRINEQKEIATKVLQSIREVDFAVARHDNMVKEKQKIKEKILASKLKPKGRLMLQKQKKSEK